MPQSLHTIFAAFIGINSCSAATLLLDDFSIGDFDLSSSGTASDSIPLSTPLTNERTVTGVGASTWSSTLASGELDYIVSHPRPGRHYLEINYSASGTFSILGFDAFALGVADVTGTGEFIVFVDGAPTFGALRIPVTQSGELTYLISEVVTDQSFDSISQMNFRFIPSSEDFSVTIDNVRLIPEPSSFSLVALGLSIAILARRRKFKLQDKNR